MNLTKVTTARIKEVRTILKRHDGAIAEVARELDPPVTTQAVSIVLRRGTKSKRVWAACEAKARELLKQEEAAKAA